MAANPMVRGFSGPKPSVHSAAMSTRYQCYACGNRTRFDVVVTRRTAAYYHFTIGGERAVEEETVLEESVESVRCRWCGADDDRVAAITDDDLEPAGSPARS
jgi:hypothetical protein